MSKIKYSVTIPIKGTTSFEVEADDEDGAIAAAWEMVEKGYNGDVTWEYFEDARTGDVPEAFPYTKTNAG